MVGISADSQWAHKAYADSLGATFSLLADRWGEVGRAYGLWNPALRCEHRAAVIIDQDMTVRYVRLYRDGDFPSIDEIIETLKGMKPGRKAA